MGLDNGFVAKNVKLEDIPDWIIRPFEDINPLEFAYWRKCWGIRGEILRFLHGNDDGYTKIDLEDMHGIIQILKKFLNPEYWENNADSIWEYEQFFDNQLNNIMNLQWLENYWEKHPEVELYFYDSY